MLEELRFSRWHSAMVGQFCISKIIVNTLKTNLITHRVRRRIHVNEVKKNLMSHEVKALRNGEELNK